MPNEFEDKLLNEPDMITTTALLPEHWQEVKRIYEEGIATGNATFQTAAPTWEEWDLNHLKICRIVAVEDHKVLGWTALNQVSGRPVYAGVAEVGIYVSADSRGKNIGSLLLGELITQSEQNGIWTLQSGIFPENKASIALHKKNGFRMLGVRERIGKMGAIWRDNLMLERRSSVVGVD